MKILLIHNRYKLKGGEDIVFEAENSLLGKNNNVVRQLIFDNSKFDSLVSLIRLSYQLIYNKKSRKIVSDAITDFNPDVIHVHNLFYSASPSILYAAYRKKIPVIVTLHNYRLICSGALLLRDSKPCTLCVGGKFPIAGIRYKCHRNSVLQTAQLTITTGIHKVLTTWNGKVYKYIALTPFARNKFLNSSLHLNSSQVIVKANSVDDDIPLRFKERDSFFLFVGRLSKEKGIDILLNAFEQSKLPVEIIGDGPLRSLVDQAESNNENIKFHGFRDKAFIMDKLKKCRALIFPSICYENLPTSILEAYSVGTPVIISNIDNLNKIVIPNYNGIHFETGNSTDLISTVINFDANVHLYEYLYENARTTYLEKYTHDINYNNLITIYSEAIKNAFNH